MTGKLDKNFGYTLIEVVVSTAIFLIMFVIVADLAVMFTKSPGDLVKKKKIESDLDYAMEFMAQKIRTNTIDFAQYTAEGITLSATTPIDTLYLINKDGEKKNFSLDTHTLLFSDNINDDSLVSNYVYFDDINFYIYPIETPWVYEKPGGYAYNIQPRVLISLQAHYYENGVEYNDISLNLQTTISSRLYER